MTLRLTTAIPDGIARVFTTTGGILFAALLAYMALFTTALNTAIAALLPPEAVNEVVGLTLPIPGTVAGLLVLGSYVLLAAYFVVLARALTRPRSELSTFPREIITRRLGVATLWMLLGGIVVGLSVMVGLVLFILPGLFLAASFFFFIFAVGVEDRGPLESLRRSWGLSRGNRIRLIVLVIVIGILGGVIGGVGAVFEAAGEPVIADVVSIVVNSVVFVFMYGIMAAVYAEVTEKTAAL